MSPFVDCHIHVQNYLMYLDVIVGVRKHAGYFFVYKKMLEWWTASSATKKNVPPAIPPLMRLL
ncbi:MAG: hypothetical protein FWG64_05155 [Firmicutes bacterium]|nr:hypothetical protein [Bacillota bacterium]